MKTTQLHYQSGKWINIPTKKEANPLKAQLVLVFGAGIVVGDAQVYDYVKNYFPHADIISCSTSGEILADNVYDDTAVVTAIQLE
ncbi:MAG: FIST N-terminal domain-containing protein, partial [Sediminibacterium sp.]